MQIIFPFCCTFIKKNSFRGSFVDFLFSLYTSLFMYHEILYFKKSLKVKDSQKYTFFLLSVVLFINLDCFDVSCLILEILAVEISAFSPI